MTKYTHAYLPVAAPVGRAREYLGDHRLDVRPGHGGRMRQKMVIRAFRQPGRPEQVPEPMSQPRQHGDDHRSVPVADLHASRASTFSRYATLALRYAFSSSRSCSLVGAGLGLDFAPLGLPFGFGRSASGPPDRYSRHQLILNRKIIFPLILFLWKIIVYFVENNISQKHIKMENRSEERRCRERV